MKHGINMTHGNALKNIIRFSLPIMVSSVLQYNYNLVDMELDFRF